jgi:RTX calcium-binding nonapeptide repeat (4 copies)
MGHPARALPTVGGPKPYIGGGDTVLARGGNDRVCGGAGRDRLIGGPGRDRTRQ